MNKTTYTITCFELADGFFVDVLEEKGTIEFYLYKKTCGVKMFMFSLLKDSAPPCKWEKIIADNVSDFIQTYIEEHDY